MRAGGAVAVGAVASLADLVDERLLVELDRRRLVAHRLDPGDRPIIAYCGGGTCEISMGVADALIAAGIAATGFLLVGLIG